MQHVCYGHRMKHVVVFRCALLPGSETFIKEQCLHLVRWRPMLLGLERASGCLPLHDIPHQITHTNHPPLLQRICRWLGCGRGLLPSDALPLAKGHQPDLVHAHFGPDGVMAAQLAQDLGVPLLITLHGYDVFVSEAHWQGGSRGRYMADYPAQIRKLASKPWVHLVAVSQAVKQQAVHQYGIAENKISVAYIGIDTQKFTPSEIPMPSRGLTICFVGRLVPKKGLHVLVEAVARAARSVPNIRLRVIGDGPERAALTRLAAELNCPVDFLGHQPPESVANLLSESRLFCLPSVTAPSGDAEGFGLVILEAQSCGVPVLTSARGGATEGILEGQTGFSFAEGDVETLTARIVELIDDAPRLEAMGLRARAFVQSHFDIRDCTPRLEAIYDHMTSAT
jgi:colanic acid/amylovoran biosynthesis glycosyltransferase